MLTSEDRGCLLIVGVGLTSLACGAVFGAVGFIGAAGGLCLLAVFVDYVSQK